MREVSYWCEGQLLVRKVSYGRERQATGGGEEIEVSGVSYW